MNNTYSLSYVEVLEILKHIPKEDYEKIPKEKIEFYENNKDKNYVYIYNPVNPKISRKTDAILINLYKNYIAKDDEKEKRRQEVPDVSDWRFGVLQRQRRLPDRFGHQPGVWR